MCLYSKELPHKATEDIICYKMIKKIDDTPVYPGSSKIRELVWKSKKRKCIYITPYIGLDVTDAIINKGYICSEQIPYAPINLCGEYKYDIGYIHTFANESIIYDDLESSFSIYYKYIFYKCIIPKNTFYVSDNEGEYCSEKIKVIKQWKPSYMKLISHVIKRKFNDIKNYMGI